MSDKAIVIISTAEAEKAYTGLMYAVNALKNRWMEDIKLIFFGPAEKRLIADKVMQDYLQQYLDLKGEAVACKFISDRDNTSAEIENFGVKIEFVGQMISDLIKEGYAPLIW